ncbi:hypothetical protein Psuf_068010 [Phytohabitans suffuscus]|uniref:Uncharacterized protein n=1 Tax=Phytohabitans suffuscus TaxID=624315 RepID=A0A6F8YU78_9ACTN|nr:hypothetical protein Psuf_068010 [Phytohabitans suffuscus]
MTVLGGLQVGPQGLGCGTGRTLLRSTVAAAGVPGARLTHRDYVTSVANADGWWRLMLGSGFRNLVMRIEEDRRGNDIRTIGQHRRGSGRAHDPAMRSIGAPHSMSGGFGPLRSHAYIVTRLPAGM